jgi:hypothetical protein
LITLWSAAPALCADDSEAGFVSLFDGKSLDGWQGSTKGYVAQDGVILCKKEGGGNLYTNQEYSDFVFRFEFKLTPAANNGIGIRAPLGGNPAFDGIEIQILDHDHEQYKDIKPWQAHGSVYGVVPAERGYLKPVGEWNSEEITVQGSHFVVKLNGHVIVDADVAEASKNGTLDGAAHPGLKRKSGHIAFCGHGAELEFRNIRVKELPTAGDGN